MSNLTEIVQEVIQQEQPPQESEADKKERIKYEKKCLALEKARATRAKNKASKDQIKHQKMKMIEKIHDRVESFDMTALMKKMDEIIYKPPNVPRLEKPKKKEVIDEYPEIEPRTPSPPPEEEEDQYNIFKSKARAKLFNDSGEYSIF